MTKITNTNILSAFRKQVGISKADEIAFVEAFQSIFEEALLRDKILCLIKKFLEENNELYQGHFPRPFRRAENKMG